MMLTHWPTVRLIYSLMTSALARQLQPGAPLLEFHRVQLSNFRRMRALKQTKETILSIMTSLGTQDPHVVVQGLPKDFCSAF
jgi:hypothetical protein